MGTEIRVLIAAGGTGGHVIPALQVAREIRRRGGEVLFAGGSRGLETRLVPEHGFALEQLKIGGLNRVGLTQLLSTFGQLPGALWRSFQILQRFRPQVVYGAGAYVSGPILLVAALKGLPVVVHEANAVPGITNRWLAPLVTRALVVEEGARRFFPAQRTEVIGLPVAGEFFTIPPKEHHPPYVVFITGGSQGSSRLNRAVCEALPALASRRDLFLLHQTGERECKALQKAYAEQGVVGEVTAFIREMPRAMARADLVVCRAGASTLAELAAAGRAALLVPFPYATGDHQYHNALARERAGAARLIRDAELDGPRLLREIDDMLPSLAALEKNVRKFAAPGATQRIVDVLESVKSVSSVVSSHVP